MSASRIVGTLAIAMLAGLTVQVSAQDGAATGSTILSENSWNFGDPDSIPGFGTLPQGYDARPVLPRFSGE